MTLVLRRAILTVLGTAAATVACATKPRSPGFVAITGATLIDGTGAPPIANATVIVRDGRIVSVASGGTVPARATVIRADGKWIIPGMIDLHVHFAESARPGAQPTFVVDLRRLFPFEQEIAWMKARVPFTLTRYLCSGVTSVVVLGAIPWEYQVRTLAESTGVGPRVLLAGGIVDVIPADSLYPRWGNDRMSYLIQTASAAAPLMDTLAATRIDLLKVAYDLPARATSAEHAEAIAPFVALFRESHERGIKVSAHATSLVEAKRVLEAGADILAHPVLSGPVDDEFLALAKSRGAYVTSTVGVVRGHARLVDSVYAEEPAEVTCGDPEVRAAWLQWSALPRSDRPPPHYDLSRWQSTERFALQNLARVQAHGIPIVVGSDGGNIGTQHGPGFQRELRLLAGAGLTPMEIILAATSNGARALGREADLGTVQAGRFADLVVLDADPLADIANLDRISQVMVRGRFFARSDLALVRP